MEKEAEARAVELPELDYSKHAEPKQVPTPRQERRRLPVFVGEGKLLPTVMWRERLPTVVDGSTAMELSFRNLQLPPNRRAHPLGGGNGARVYRVEEVGNVFYVELPPFEREHLEAAGRAKHVVIRELAGEMVLGAREHTSYFDMEERRERLERAAAVARRALADIAPLMDERRKEALARMIAADTVGFGPIEFLWNTEEELEEVEINHPYREIVVYHRKYGRCITNLAMNGERGFRRVMNAILRPLGQSLDSVHPSVDAQLPDGSRLHAQLYPLALSGASANIRFIARDTWTIPRMIAAGTLSAGAAAYLWMAIGTRRTSIVISGPPASGKTSFLSALLVFLLRGERVISIEEEMNELRFYDGFIDWVPLRGVHEERKADAWRKSQSVTNLKTPLEQVVSALRMRPDRIIVGEIRGAEAQRLFAGANLGMPFMTTMHANERGAAVLSRLHSPPMSVGTESLSQLDIIVCMAPDVERTRRVWEISELAWESRGQFPERIGEGQHRGRACGGLVWEDGEDAAFLNVMYAFDPSKREHRAVGKYPSSVLDVFARTHGMKKSQVEEELRRRELILSILSEQGRFGFAEVGRVVQAYSETAPEERASFPERLRVGELI